MSRRLGEKGEDVLLAALEMDEGARFVGELGIGCNAGDHAADAEHPLRREDGRHRPPGGRPSYPKVGGKNVSALHWDLVKDLRSGGRIELDGEVVQENGTWLI